MDAERWRLVDTIVAEAFDLPEADRAAFLDERCGEDAELRARVERLLAADREAEGFLEEPPLERIEALLAEAAQGSGHGDPALDAETARELEPGTTVGRYVVQEKLGAGGMGTVYAAWDPELGRSVALKLVHPDRLSGQSRERLLREAQALARVSHPNVVTVYDVGRHGDGVFLAMEHVRGGTLDGWLESRERGWRAVVTAFLAAARGLAAAHDAGIVHRDFKPSNVLRDERGRLRVADFGLARAAGPAGDEPGPLAGAVAPPERPPGRQTVALGPVPPAGGDEAGADGAATNGARNRRTGEAGDTDGRPTARPPTASPHLATPLTDTGWMVGTPSYMAPEQHTHGEVGPTTDQFAFCVALYRAVYGVHPFAADTPAETRRRVLAGEVAPPPKGTRVPRRLRAVLLRGMAAAPEERWTSMAELIRALERVADRRSRLLPAAAVVAAVGLLAVLLWPGDGTGEGEAPGGTAAPEPPPSVAVLPFRNLGGDPEDAFLSEGITDELISNLVRVEPLQVPARRSVYALHDRGLEPAEIAERLGAAHVLQGTVERSGDRLRVTARLVRGEDGRELWSQSYDRRFEDVFQLQEAIARAIVDRLEVELTGEEPLVDRPTDSLQAYSLYLRGRSHFNRRSVDDLHNAIDLFERALAEDPGYAEAHAGLADAWSWITAYAPGSDPEALEKARDAAEQALELKPESAAAHASLGLVLMRSGEPLQAEEQLRWAIELEPAYANAHHWYGLLLVRHLHRPRDAVVELELARRLDPASSPTLDLLAQAYYRAGRFEDALRAGRELLVLDPEWEWGFKCISTYYNALRRWEDAIAAAEALGDPADWTPACRREVAEAHHFLGSYEAELTVSERGLAERPRDLYFLEAKGAALAAMGRADEAERLFEDILSTARADGYSWYSTYNIVGELRVHGQADLARTLAARLADWHRHNLPGEDRSFESALTLTLALVEAGRADRGAAVLDAWLSAATVDERRETHLPDPWLTGYEAWMAALQDRKEEAQGRLRALSDAEPDSLAPPFEAITLSALGEREMAVAAMEERLRRGLVLNREVHALPGLQQLRQEPRMRSILDPGTTAIPASDDEPAAR